MQWEPPADDVSQKALKRLSAIEKTLYTIEDILIDWDAKVFPYDLQR